VSTLDCSTLIIAKYPTWSTRICLLECVIDISWWTSNLIDNKSESVLPQHNKNIRYLFPLEWFYCGPWCVTVTRRPTPPYQRSRPM